MLILAVLGALFVNGATDAPGTVAGAVAGGILTRRRAAAICAVFNFAGMVVSSMLHPAVGKSISEITVGRASPAASLTAVIIYAVVAWRFGIPTSESHALIAGLGGAALYYNGTPGETFFEITLKGILSCVTGFILGYALCRILRRRHAPCIRPTRLIAAVCAAGASACHGSQDGQKLISLISPDVGNLHAPALLIPAAVMATGCLVGGRKIIDRIGHGMAGTPDITESTASDTSSLVCTLIASAAGIPISTTYMKTSGMLGAAVADGRYPNRREVLPIIAAWAVTYPVCMLLSYILCSAAEFFLTH